MNQKNVPLFPYGRNDLGRTPTLTRTDVFLQHTFRLWNTHRINLGLNIINLFDQKTVTRRATSPYRDSFNVSDAAFFSGTVDPRALATAAPNTYRPNATYNLPGQYQARREMRLQLRYSF